MTDIRMIDTLATVGLDDASLNVYFAVIQAMGNYARAKGTLIGFGYGQGVGIKPTNIVLRAPLRAVLMAPAQVYRARDVNQPWLSGGKPDIAPAGREVVVDQIQDEWARVWLDPKSGNEMWMILGELFIPPPS